jgi:hypothetical protein
MRMDIVGIRKNLMVTSLRAVHEKGTCVGAPEAVPFSVAIGDCQGNPNAQPSPFPRNDATIHRGKVFRDIFLLLVTSFLWCQGCTPSTASEAEIKSFLQNEDNGLIKKTEDEGFAIEALYRPTDFIVKQQMEKGSSKEIDSLRKAYATYHYFLLTISKNEKDLETHFAYDIGSFANKISFLASDFSSKISLQTANKDYAIQDYVYTRSYGTGPSHFLLVFEKPTETEFKLTIEGYELGFGKVQFAFDQNNIKKIPNLKF